MCLEGFFRIIQKKRADDRASVTQVTVIIVFFGFLPTVFVYQDCQLHLSFNIYFSSGASPLGCKSLAEETQETQSRTLMGRSETNTNLRPVLGIRKGCISIMTLEV